MRNYNDYIDFLKDSMKTLSDYNRKTGRKNTRVERLRKDLSDDDPFVTYRASKVASRLLNDDSLYH